jgi:hypothetical protein
MALWNPKRFFYNQLDYSFIKCNFDVEKLTKAVSGVIFIGTIIN